LTQDLTTHWVGLTALLLFILAYLLVIAEEYTHLRKSKPVVLAAGLIWALLAFEYADGESAQVVEQAVEHFLVEFAKLFLSPSEYDLGTRSSCADGMTIDTEGNIYVATNMGLQIFAPSGDYIGSVNVPIRPVSAVFGGDNLDTIYMTCATHVYKIRTNMTGLTYPLK